MLFIWLIIYIIQPYLLLFGILGIFGKEAEEAAVYLLIVLVIGLLFLAALAVLYFLGTWIYGLIGFSAIAAFV